MRVNTILKQSRLNLPILAKLAQVDLGYLKQLSAGNSAAGPDTREKLAKALRAHSETLATLADALERPTS